MARTRTVVNCALYQEHGAARLGGAAADHLPPHTREETYTEEEEAVATSEQTQARAERLARAEARQQRSADLTLLREQGAAHPDPLVQAAARLLAGALPVPAP